MARKSTTKKTTKPEAAEQPKAERAKTPSERAKDARRVPTD